MRVDATPDRLELRFDIVGSPGCLIVVALMAGIPLVVAGFMARSEDPIQAVIPAGVGVVFIALTLAGRWLTKARCILDRITNEARIEHRGLAADASTVGERLALNAAIGSLDLVEGAEVLENTDADGDTFYKPALRIRGRKPIPLTDYGNGSRREADEAVRVVLEWLAKAGPTSSSPRTS